MVRQTDRQTRQTVYLLSNNCIQGITPTTKTSPVVIDMSRYNPSYFKAQRGVSSSTNSTSSEQIATLNTELGHLTATVDHLKEKLRQVLSQIIVNFSDSLCI